MIKPLRHKFVFVNMITVLMVMIVAFYCNYAFNKANMYNESVDILESTIRDGKPKNMKTFLVVADSSGKIYRIEGYVGTISDDYSDLNGLVKSAVKSDKTIADFNNHDLRYLKKTVGNAVLIAFIGTESEKVALKGIVDFSLYIYICCFVVFLLFSFYLAKLATEPVERAFNQKKQLVADASHELKTPLTAIIASSDVLLSSNAVSDEDKAWAKSIKSSASDMSELLADMLALAKSDGEKTERTETRLDFSSLATEVGLNYEAALFEDGKFFKTNVEPGIFVKGNENELKQLMKIFLDNARKYSAKNGLVELSLKTIKDKAVLTVYDTGEPIPEKELDKIFDRFYRVDKVRGNASGYGLGLSIAKNIAQAHSTRIYVKSDVNGTSFSVPFKCLK